MNWPDEVIKAIAKRKSVLFLGAGVSANSKTDEGQQPPTWEKFLEDIIAKYATKLNEYNDELNSLLREKNYLTACEIIVDVIGENKFADYTADRFRRPGYNPSRIHELIFTLDSKIVITPNVDKIYEQYAGQHSKGTIVVKSYTDGDIAKYIRSDDYLLIQSHGKVDDPSTLIFTHKQYAEARCKYASFYQLLDALILTHTFIFLGCGINDPDIEMLLENSNFSFPLCNPHYFVISRNSLQAGIMKSIQKNRNIEFLEYEKGDEIHGGLIKSLDELNQLVEVERANGRGV